MQSWLWLLSAGTIFPPKSVLPFFFFLLSFKFDSTPLISSGIQQKVGRDSGWTVSSSCGKCLSMSSSWYFPSHCSFVCILKGKERSWALANRAWILSTLQVPRRTWALFAFTAGRPEKWDWEEASKSHHQALGGDFPAGQPDKNTG